MGSVLGVIGAEDEGDGLDKPGAELGVAGHGGLKAVEGALGGGDGVDGCCIGGGGLGKAFGALDVVEAFDEDLDAGEPGGGAVVEQVGFEPGAGGGVINGAEELAEAVGARVAVLHDRADGHARQAGTVFKLASIDGGAF